MESNSLKQENANNVLRDPAFLYRPWTSLAYVNSVLLRKLSVMEEVMLAPNQDFGGKIIKRHYSFSVFTTTHVWG